MPATITDFIRRDLRERIEAGHPLPTPLTLVDLAKYYRVSPTPVRQAVRSLLKDQFLRRQSNGRLQVHPARLGGGATGVAACPYPTSPGPMEWEASLIEEIVLLSLRGSVEYLREEAIAHRHGVGRTMLRQVFNRLAGKGLIQHVPRCGWRVRRFDEEDMGAYLLTREVLELTALDQARPYLAAADLERMLRGNAPLSDGSTTRLDNHLHAYLIEKSGNAYIQDFFERHGLYYTTLFDFAAPEAHVMSEMADQHREILQALLQEDWIGAREALSRHIRAQRPIVKHLMERITDHCVEAKQGARL